MRRFTVGVLVLCVLLGAGAHAQERKAYRHVDPSGKVTYSQTPPADAKAVEKIDISPAQRGRGGDTGTYSTYDDPRYYAGQRGYERYPQTPPPGAREQRLAELKAECERQRGTDCNNPSTLRYLESTQYPRGTSVVRRAPSRTPYPH